MAEPTIIARLDTIKKAIEVHREARKTLARQTTMFGARFVADHDAQLKVLQRLKASRY